MNKKNEKPYYPEGIPEESSKHLGGPNTSSNKLFCKTENRGLVFNSFYEVNIKLIQTSNQDIRRKENYKSKSLP